MQSRHNKYASTHASAAALRRSELFRTRECAPVAGALAGLLSLEGISWDGDLEAHDDLTVDPAQDFRAAAALAHAVRRSGHTVRSLTDCLIAAIALRHGGMVWHCDADYVRIAEVSDL